MTSEDKHLSFFAAMGGLVFPPIVLALCCQKVNLKSLFLWISVLIITEVASGLMLVYIWHTKITIENYGNISGAIWLVAMVPLTIMFQIVIMVVAMYIIKLLLKK